MCRVQMNCFDTISGPSYYIGHFRIDRVAGPGVGGFIYYNTATSGLAVAVAISGTTFKLQVAESVGHLVNVDGLVKYEAIW